MASEQQLVAGKTARESTNKELKVHRPDQSVSPSWRTVNETIVDHAQKVIISNTNNEEEE